MVVISRPKIQMLYVSQLSTTHCVYAEVQASSFSFYVASCYFQYNDKIERYLAHLKKVFHALRGKRLLVALDSNVRSSVWGLQETDKRGRKFEDIISAYEIIVINDLDQSPTYGTAKRPLCINVTLACPTMSQFLGE